MIKVEAPRANDTAPFGSRPTRESERPTAGGSYAKIYICSHVCKHEKYSMSKVEGGKLFSTVEGGCVSAGFGSVVYVGVSSRRP
jgi:hypothetical protein